MGFLFLGINYFRLLPLLHRSLICSARKSGARLIIFLFPPINFNRRQRACGILSQRHTIESYFDLTTTQTLLALIKSASSNLLCHFQTLNYCQANWINFFFSCLVSRANINCTIVDCLLHVENLEFSTFFYPPSKSFHIKISLDSTHSRCCCSTFLFSFIFFVGWLKEEFFG